MKQGQSYMDNAESRKKRKIRQEYGKIDERLERVKQFLSEKPDEELSEMVKPQSIFPEYVKYYAVQELKKRKDEREKRFKKTSKQPTKSSWDDDAYFDFLQERNKDALQAVEEMSKRPLSLEQVEEQMRRMRVSRGLEPLPNRKIV